MLIFELLRLRRQISSKSDGPAALRRQISDKQSADRGVRAERMIGRKRSGGSTAGGLAGGSIRAGGFTVVG